MRKGSVAVSFCVTTAVIFTVFTSWQVPGALPKIPGSLKTIPYLEMFFNNRSVESRSIYDESVRIPNFWDKVPHMQKIFDDQIADLRERGFGDEFIGDLLLQRTSIPIKAAKMDICEGNIPFVPAINVTYGLSGRCGTPKFKHNDKKINIKNKKQFFGLGELYSLDSHTGPYYVFDVSSGQDMLGLSPKEAKTKLASLGRRPLNVIEGAFLFILGGDISKNGMWFAGSGCHGRVPVAYMEGDEVYVDAEDPNNKYSDRGVVSCAKE